MAETVRSVTELLDVLFASNQAPRSITEQDMRDAIVSISLETADFSGLPTSAFNLPVGRCWIDSTTALRVVLVFQESALSSLAGSGSLSAQGVLGGVSNAWPANAQLGATAGISATPTQVFGLFARASLGGSGSMAASPLQRLRGAAGLTGVASDIAIPSPLSGGAFSSAFSTAFKIGGSIATAQIASATLRPAGGIIATPQRGTVTTWDPASTSIYITLSGSASFSTAFSAAFATSGPNLKATKTANAGWYGGTKATVFRTSGKWYWEVSIGAKAGDTGVGLANPSWPVDNSDPTFGSYLGSDTNSIGLYGDVSNGYVNGGAGLNVITQPMPNVVGGGIVGIALDCDNWKWWARQNGGAWNVGQAGAQDPASNQGGLAIGASYRTGGIGPAITLQALNDNVSGRFSPASWGFVPPVGFAAI